MSDSKSLKGELALAGSRIAALRLPPGLRPAAGRLGSAQRLLGNIERRLDEGAGAPLRLALFGPTGVGKSKLFNSILGEVVSPAGFRRPFTTRPVYSIPTAHAGLAPRVEGLARMRAGDLWPDVVIIDTPDFDSVELQNRNEAERVFREADAFLFVTDVQKYADRSTWEYLERIHAERKPVIVVLNKATGAAAASDFRSRLAARLGGDDIIVVSEQAIDDATLIPSNDPALSGLRTRVREVFGDAEDRREALLAAFRADLDQLWVAWREAATLVHGFAQGVADLRVRLAERFARAHDGLIAAVAAPIDQGVKAEVYAQTLERLRRIDVLRYPRRLLALPFEAVKLLAARWMPARGSGRRQTPEEAQRDQALQHLEGRLLSLCEESQNDLRSEARCPELLDPEQAASLRIPHAELSALFRAREADYRRWLEKEAKETASKLTSDSKLKFILSQVIYNGVMVGVQIHTAGHFTLLEAAADGVLSPLFAKAIGMAVSSEKVGQFEKRARAEHARLLGEILAQARGRVEDLLDASVAWQAHFASLELTMRELEASQPDLVKAYDAGPLAASAPGQAGA